jgi:hypothetical protein
METVKGSLASRGRKGGTDAQAKSRGFWGTDVMPCDTRMMDTSAYIHTYMTL